MSKHEKFSGCISHLLFIVEIVHGTHLEAIMKSVEWQQKMLRGNLRVSRVKDKDSNERRNKKLPNRTKYTARLKKSSSTILTARTYCEDVNFAIYRSCLLQE